MLLRTISDAKTVEWGNGLSRRLLVAADGLGYSVTDTIVRPGTRSRLQYSNHLESCYCIAGSGWVVDRDGRRHRLIPGTLYALDDHDPHCLVASDDEELRLVCVFSPALRGDEVHNLGTDGYSSYGPAESLHALTGTNRR
jgi:L-ectoine synthase